MLRLFSRTRHWSLWPCWVELAEGPFAVSCRIDLSSANPLREEKELSAILMAWFSVCKDNLIDLGWKVWGTALITSSSKMDSYESDDPDEDRLLLEESRSFSELADFLRLKMVACDHFCQCHCHRCKVPPDGNPDGQALQKPSNFQDFLSWWAALPQEQMKVSRFLKEMKAREVSLLVLRKGKKVSVWLRACSFEAQLCLVETRYLLFKVQGIYPTQ